MAPQACKVRAEPRVPLARWWSVVPAKLVLPAPQVREVLPGRRALKARASRVLLARWEVLVPQACKA